MRIWRENHFIPPFKSNVTIYFYRQEILRNLLVAPDTISGSHSKQLRLVPAMGTHKNFRLPNFIRQVVYAQHRLYELRLRMK